MDLKILDQAFDMRGWEIARTSDKQQVRNDEAENVKSNKESPGRVLVR